VHDVEDVLESVSSSLTGVSELGKQLRLNDSVRLSDNKIVPIWVLVESVLQEVGGSGVEGSFHTEESDCK
jgi:hypothetical protein